MFEVLGLSLLFLIKVLGQGFMVRGIVTVWRILWMFRYGTGIGAQIRFLR